MKQTLFEWMSIDLGRLTPIGWLLVLVTLIIMVGTPFFFFSLSDPDVAKKSGSLKMVGLGSILLSLGFFYGLKFFLERKGIQVQTPAK